MSAPKDAWMRKRAASSDVSNMVDVDVGGGGGVGGDPGGGVPPVGGGEPVAGVDDVPPSPPEQPARAKVEHASAAKKCFDTVIKRSRTTCVLSDLV